MKEKITLAQGAGGQQMDDFIKQMILSHFTTSIPSMEVPLTMLDDSAVIDDIVFSTDSHTVQPLQFPGGNIGSLAVAGTINDVAVMGATPLALSAGFIIEEGFSRELFSTIVESMSRTAQRAQTPIITGDTKVVEKGAIQEFMVNTSGIGRRSRLLDQNLEEVRRYREIQSRWLLDENIREGDVIIVSGNMGEHGIALMSFREGYGFETDVRSDVAPINGLMTDALSIGGIVSAKDPTRGGLANTLNEFSEKSKCGILIDEERLPIPAAVHSACDMLGLDPLHIGNEGKVVLGVVKQQANEILKKIRKHPLGKNAEIIGEVTNTVRGVVLKTSIGGTRIIQKPLGDPIPRIC